MERKDKAYFIEHTIDGHAYYAMLNQEAMELRSSHYNMTKLLLKEVSERLIDTILFYDSVGDTQQVGSMIKQILEADPLTSNMN